MTAAAVMMRRERREFLRVEKDPVALDGARRGDGVQLIVDFVADHETKRMHVRSPRSGQSGRNARR